MKYSANRIKNAMLKKDYTVFTDNGFPFNINLVGVRSKDNAVNIFNDVLCVFYDYRSITSYIEYQITTDPGLYWLKEPMNVLGCAILKEGRYKGMWKVGKHLDKYEALVQAAPCVVIRDFDRDEFLDYDSGREDIGVFGINCHRGFEKGITYQVDKWSAGCQVFADASDFEKFMVLCNKAADIYGNSFTYTLFNEKDIPEA